MKKVLVLEDNAAVLKHISSIIKKTDMKAAVFPIDNISDAYRCATEKTMDLFIVDIILDRNQPNDSSGLRFIENIRQIKHYSFTPIIVVTALEDSRLYTYEKLHCYSFVEKPFEEERLKRLVEEALCFPGIDENRKTLYFRKDGIIQTVERESIVYVESVNHVLHIHTNCKDVMRIPYMTIGKLMEEADSNDFIQCSRSTVINKRYIHNLDITNRVIQLKDEMGRVEIGVMYKNRLKEVFG